MPKFLELPSGRIINLDNIREFNPTRSNRLDWLVGGHEIVTDRNDLAALLKALRGTPRRRGPKTTEPPRKN